MVGMVRGCHVEAHLPQNPLQLGAYLPTLSFRPRIIASSALPRGTPRPYCTTMPQE